jgi:hypothetical protein
MVDRGARDEYAEIIEAFLRGEVSNHQYDDVASRLQRKSEDDLIEETYRFLWGGYSDVTKQYVDDLDPQAQAAFRRCAVFLRSNRECEWPLEALGGVALAWGCVVLPLAALCLLYWAVVSLSWLPVVVGWPVIAATWVLWRLRLRKLREERKGNLAAIGDVDAFPFLSVEQYQEEAAKQAAGRHVGA